MAIYTWESACNKEYTPLSLIFGINESEWSSCPSCKEKPRLWIFDNGKHAKCRCQHKWDAPQVSGLDINSYIGINGSLEGYSNNDIRDNWNDRCSALINSTK